MTAAGRLSANSSPRRSEATRQLQRGQVLGSTRRGARQTMTRAAPQSAAESATGAPSKPRYGTAQDRPTMALTQLQADTTRGTQTTRCATAYCRTLSTTASAGSAGSRRRQ